MARNRNKKGNKKVLKSLDEHKNHEGFIDINEMIYEMHGVLSNDPYSEISKAHKYL